MLFPNRDGEECPESMLSHDACATKHNYDFRREIRGFQAAQRRFSSVFCGKVGCHMTVI